LLYEVLAALWDGPANDLEVARAIEDRTGERFSRDAADRYLRLIRDCGFANSSANELSPRYAITADGSQLLARLARDVDSKETVSA
jgi:DNA-binding PadR family transcriptional regulator